VKSDDLEIGRILHLKSEIKNLKLDDPSGKDESNESIPPTACELTVERHENTHGSSNLRFLISDCAPGGR
jgi:hypothetical protein